MLSSTATTDESAGHDFTWKCFREVVHCQGNPLTIINFHESASGKSLIARDIHYKLSKASATVRSRYQIWHCHPYTDDNDDDDGDDTCVGDVDNGGDDGDDDDDDDDDDNGDDDNDDEDDE